MIRYQIRSVALLNLVNEIQAGRLISNPYFQRNLVWREIHKKDFIQTILKGFPFPQLFFSRGKIDLKEMQALSCIVDGQQRTNAIVEFVDNKIQVDGKYFSDLSDSIKSSFFKYEIGIVELDIENDDPVLKEIFQRLNRTSNSLSAIEKLDSEFGASEYMLTARLLIGQLDFPGKSDEEALRLDPAIPEAFFKWAKKAEVADVQGLFEQIETFSTYEVARKVPLFYMLNMMSTFLGGYFNRNEKSLDFLETFKDDFPERDRVILAFNSAAATFAKLKLPKESMWCQKANFFTLMTELAVAKGEKKGIRIADTRAKLSKFESSVPEDYLLAAREAVNNKRERTIRAKYVAKLIVQAK